jgi:probable rRNA maturation factor
MISVGVANTHRRERCPSSLLVRCVRAVMQGEAHRNGEVSVVCISDGVSRRMNRRFLHHDYATDVICFPLGEGDAIEGELYVNLDRARVQARRFAVTPTHELARLVVHGTLHLLGYDDLTPADRLQMQRREDHYLMRIMRPRRRKGSA